MAATEHQRLVYRDKFRSLHNEAFQTWFEGLARALHPSGDFQAIRQTQGDGGLDGFAINAQKVYQVYAPARIDELRDSQTGAKIKSDFQVALSTLGGQLKCWTFVHNHPEAKVGQRTATALTKLKTENPGIEITVLDIDSLWERLRELPDHILVTLFGSADPLLPSVGQNEQLRGIEALMRAATETVLRSIQQKGSEFSLTSVAVSTSEKPFQISLPIGTSIPPTAPDIGLRTKVVEKLTSTLQKLRILILVGSSGTGKTTLAKLTAAKRGGPWLWMNLVGTDPLQYRDALVRLVIRLQESPTSNNVILDDVNLAADYSRQVEESFAHLRYLVSQREGCLIITSQKDLPQRLSRHLGLRQENTETAPAMIPDEIADLALQLGCQSRDEARAWAAISLVHTSGHVQLVHAQLKGLARLNWPKPSSDHLLKRPTDVEKELSDARMLLQGLSEGHRELLYRLSIVAGNFRRDHAIAIGELKPAVARVGEVYDQLIGPWVEYVDNDHMRVSPLLKNSGNQVWSADVIKEWYEATGVAILRCSPRTQWEASTVLMHGILAGSGGLIQLVINSILSSPEKLIKEVAPSLFWLKYFTKSGTPIFPKSKSVNFMLRLLQFKVTAELEPTEAADVLAAWESDPMPDSPLEFAKYARTLYLGSFLYQVKVPVPPRKLVRAIVETATLADSLPSVKEIFAKVGDTKDETGHEQRFDPISVAFLITTARPVSVRFLEELLDGLEQDAPESIRNRMLSGLRVNDSFTRMFLDAVWFNESNAAEPNWPNCIRVFERCITLAQRWNVPELLYSAARSIAIIRDEYQNDQSAALAILEQHSPREGQPSITIENERATVLQHLKQHDAALSCWERILPFWKDQPVTQDKAVLFALSKAGEAAARAGKWRKAAELFSDGASRANLLRQQVHLVGFKIDAAWALWKASEYQKCFALLCEARVSAEELPDPNMTPYVAKVQKVLGHILVCIKREIEREDYGDLGEPNPGTGSNLDSSDKWTSAPMAGCLMFLAEIECYLRLQPVVLREARTRLAMSRSPLIQCLMAELEIRYAFRELQFEKLPEFVHELEASASDSNFQREVGRTALEEADSPLPHLAPIEQSKSIASVLLAHALIGSLAHSIAPIPLIDRWRENVGKLPSYRWMNSWLDFAKRVFTIPASEVVAIMGDDALPSEMRFLAAVRLMDDQDSDVNRMFNAQAWIVSWVGQNKMFWKYDLEKYVAIVIARAWKHQCQFKATLRSPRLTVPEIERECESRTEGIAKAAKILLVASNAVSIPFSDELRKEFHALISTQVVNPYRFSNYP